MLLWVALLALLGGRVRGQDASSSATCSAVLGELESSQCGNFCGTYEPCLAFDSSTDCSATGCVSDADGLCQYTCADYLAYSFTMYIPFGSYQSDEEIAERALDNESYEQSLDTWTSDYTDGYFVINDDLITSFGSLQLNPYTTDVTIAGGTSTFGNTKGHVVNVSLEGSFLSNNTQVTTVSLYNMNLNTPLDVLPELLPSNLSMLTLNNVLLYEFPADLAALPALSSLTLSYNYLTSIDTVVGFDSLQQLLMSNNNISTFDAVFPNLGSLYLSNNNLSEIPSVIGEMPTITDLDLSYNAIASVDASFSSESLTSLTISSNQISTFEASFPNLESLYISSNQLTEIPAVVFEFKKLSSLSVSYNPLTLNFTTAQYEFLQGLTYFDFSLSTTDNLTWDCNVAELQGYAVCITDATNVTSVSTESEGSHTGAIVGGVIGGIAVIVLIVIAVLFYRKRSTKKDIMTTDTPNASERVFTGFTDSADVTKTSSTTMTLSADPALLPLQLNPIDLQDIRVIGSGTYSVYWLVKYRRTHLLASKRLRPDEATHQRIRALVKEIKLASKFDHPSIVKLVGVSWTQLELSDLHALYEYVGNGTLRDYLANPQVPRTWHHEKLELAIDVADAMVYLHSLLPIVVHRDLRSHNVLLNEEMRAMVSSFGAAREAGDDAARNSAEEMDDSGVGAGRWTAPEVLASTRDLGQAADVYSFGVLLTELDSHALPFEGAIDEASGKPLQEAAVLQKIVAGSLHPTFGFNCPPALVTLGLQCLDQNPWNRPTAPDLAYKLREVLKTLKH